RDFHVTGVQTCALPIYLRELRVQRGRDRSQVGDLAGREVGRRATVTCGGHQPAGVSVYSTNAAVSLTSQPYSASARTASRLCSRSEERRVGEEGRFGMV